MAETDGKENRKDRRRALTAVSIAGTALGIALILATLELIRRDILPFVVTQQKYVLSAEAALLGIFFTEMLARIVSRGVRTDHARNLGMRFRVMVRVAGYTVALVSVVSILASNPTFGISIGTVGGVVVAFATQNILGNVLAAVWLLNTRMVLVGEEITVAGTRGTVTDINLTHTVVHVDEDVVFVPNSVMMSTAVRRKRRDGLLE